MPPDDITVSIHFQANMLVAYRLVRLIETGEILMDPKKPRNLLRLAGVINAANSEADNEAGELIERVRRNQSRALALIAKGHQNESLREQMLSEAEKEQALADLAAATGDNGGPLLEEEDEASEKLRATLKAAKSDAISQSSEEDVQKPKEPPAAEQPPPPPANPAPPQAQQTPSPPAVGQAAPNFHE